MESAKLQVVRTFADAREFLARLQHSTGFQEYLRARLVLVVPAALVFLLISIACAAATVIVLADRHPLLALPALIFAPLILIGSFFVQAYVFASWLEDRAIAHALGRRRQGRFGLDLGKLPPVPWLLAAIFVLLPLVLLALVAAPAALVLLLLGLATPIVYARLDR